MAECTFGARSRRFFEQVKHEIVGRRLNQLHGWYHPRFDCCFGAMVAGAIYYNALPEHREDSHDPRIPELDWNMGEGYMRETLGLDATQLDYLLSICGVHNFECFGPAAWSNTAEEVLARLIRIEHFSEALMCRYSKDRAVETARWDNHAGKPRSDSERLANLRKLNNEYYPKFVAYAP